MSAVHLKHSISYSQKLSFKIDNEKGAFFDKPNVLTMLFCNFGYEIVIFICLYHSKQLLEQILSLMIAFTNSKTLFSSHNPCTRQRLN